MIETGTGLELVALNGFVPAGVGIIALCSEASPAGAPVIVYATAQFSGPCSLFF